MSWIDEQSEASELFIKGETGHTVKHLCDKHIRDGVTEGESLQVFFDILRYVHLISFFYSPEPPAQPQKFCRSLSWLDLRRGLYLGNNLIMYCYLIGRVRRRLEGFNNSREFLPRFSYRDHCFHLHRLL